MQNTTTVTVQLAVDDLQDVLKCLVHRLDTGVWSLDPEDKIEVYDPRARDATAKVALQREHGLADFMGSIGSMTLEGA